METIEYEAALSRLCHNFPDVPHDPVASMLSDSYQRVVEISGLPLIDSAEKLARLRLEVRTGHPARVMDDAMFAALLTSCFASPA